MALIPVAWLTDWTPGTYTGVPGGIPTDRTNIIDVTLAPYFADNTGVTDASAAIQDAINNAVAQDIIYFPAGIYRLDTTLNLSHNNDSITLRGDGPADTVLKPQPGAGAIAWGSGDGWGFPSPPTVRHRRTD